MKKTIETQLTIRELHDKLSMPCFNKKFEFIENIKLDEVDIEEIKINGLDFKNKLLHRLDIVYENEVFLSEEDIDFMTYVRKLDIYQFEKDKENKLAKENKIKSINKPWSIEELSLQAMMLANNSVQNLGKPCFVLDERSKIIWGRLCLYFTNDKRFNEIQSDVMYQDRIDYYDLKKPILIMGHVGTGKSTILKAFKINKRQCFKTTTADDIQEEIRTKTMSHLAKYSRPIKIDSTNELTFFQSEIGILIDDIGTEEIVNEHGNKSDCIEYILRTYYNNLINDNMKPFGLHFTTNLSLGDIKERYGLRFYDRLRETHNIMTYLGDSRR